MPWPLDQAAPWLNPAGTGAPVNDEEDGYAKYLRTFAQPVESPVPDVAWAPPHYDFTDEEANPPHYDFTDDEANPPPSDLASIEIDPTNGKEPIDPYAAPVNNGPTPIDPYSQLRDPYPPETPTPVPGGLVDRTLGRVAQKAGTANDLDRLGASETFVEKDAPDETPDQADASAADLYRRDPQARLRAELERDDLMRSEQIKLQTAANLRDAEEMKRNVERRDLARAKAQSDRAQIDADARALAQSPFKRYWSNASTGEKIGGALLAIAGGLMMPNTGGRNSGIDFMMKLADDDADQKWKAIQLRREQSGEAMADADEDFRTRETLRMAGREQVANQIRATLANFDPKGAHALAYGAGLAAIDAANAKAAAEADAENEKRAEANFKLADQARQTDIKEYEAISKDEQWRAAERRRIGVGTGGGGARGPTAGWGPKDVHSGADWARRRGLDPKVIKAQPPADDMTGKEFDDWFQSQKDQGNISAEQEREANVRQQRILDKKKFEDEREITFNGDPLYVYDKDGKVVLDEFGDPQRITAQTPAEGEAIRKRVSNTVYAAGLLDEALALREGASLEDLKWSGSPVRQRLKAIADKIVLTMKEGTQGLSSDSDMGKIATSFGADGLTDWLSRKGAIEQGRANLIDGLNNEMRQHFKYKGPALLIPNAHKAPAPKRDEDLAALNSRDDRESFGLNDATLNPLHSQAGKVVGTLDEGIEFRPSLDEKGQGGLDRLVAAIERGDADAGERAAGLAKSATGGSSKAIRNESATALWKLKQAGNPAAVAAYEKLDDAGKATVIAHLPPAEARAALRALKEQVEAPARVMRNLKGLVPGGDD